MPFLIIFIIIPFVELMVFAAVSDHIGVFTALMLTFLTAIIGGAVVRHQGLQTIFAMRLSMGQGKIPLSEIFDGFCLVAAGAMLITPGFVTDSVGFLLLIPPVRNILRAIIKTHTNWALHTPDMQDQGFSSSSRVSGDIIEGEFEEIDEDSDKA